MKKMKNEEGTKAESKGRTGGYEVIANAGERRSVHFLNQVFL